MSEETNDITLSKDAEKVLELVEKLSVLDLANLVKAMEDKFGVSAAAPVAVAAAPAGGGDAGGEAEKTEYDVHIVSIGDKKIAVIKAVKDLLGLGLKEAKDIVDAAPGPVKEKVPKAEAEKMKTAIEESGATVELK